MSHAARVTGHLAPSWGRRSTARGAATAQAAPTPLVDNQAAGELPLAMMIEGPMTGSLPFHPEQAAAGLRLVMAPREALVASALQSSWRFRLLHLVGLVLTLPLFAVERVLLGSWCEWQGETVFARADRTVTMALEYVFLE